MSDKGRLVCLADQEPGQLGEFVQQSSQGQYGYSKMVQNILTLTKDLSSLLIKIVDEILNLPLKITP